jgi:hypothetical protein
MISEGGVMRQPPGLSSISGLSHGNRQCATAHANEEKHEKQHSQHNNGAKNQSFRRSKPLHR